MLTETIKLGVELEVEVQDNPEAASQHESTYVIYGSYPKHQSLGHLHKKHGNLVAIADQKLKGKIETHYDNTVKGFEWVGKPMSLRENKLSWEKLLTDPGISPYIHGEDVKPTHHSFGMHDAGMHVHVSDDSITPATLGKIMVFVNKKDNKVFIECIAGRKLNKFCQTNPKLTIEDIDDLYHAEDCQKVGLRGKKITYSNEGHWNVYIGAGVPCCNNATKITSGKFTRGAIWLTPALDAGDFEIRIFKSTVKPDRLNVNLEFVVALVEFCQATSVSSLSFKEFGAWLSELNNKLRYVLLFKYLRKNGYTTGVIPRKSLARKAA